MYEIINDMRALHLSLSLSLSTLRLAVSTSVAIPKRHAKGPKPCDASCRGKKTSRARASRVYKRRISLEAFFLRVLEITVLFALLAIAALILLFILVISSHPPR